MKPLSPNSELHPPSSQPLTTVSPPNPDSETRLPLICRLNPKPENWFDMICDEITRIGREEARPEESDEEEVDEENIYSYLDGQRFPKCSRYWTPEYQASREARRRPMRPMSPPPTTPHLKGRKLLESNSIPPLQLTNAKIQKKRAFQRQRHRRPMTRSMSGKLLALPHRKGFVRCEPLINKYLDVSFKQYVRDFVSTTSNWPLRASAY